MANMRMRSCRRTDSGTTLIAIEAAGKIIEVDRAKTVIVLKRSMAAGFAGIENHLFYKENTRMLFGDAKASLNALVAEFKQV